MALGRWKQLDPSQRLIATASYQKAKRSDRVLTLTLTLRDALPCTNQSRRFNQLHYARFLASSSRPNISGQHNIPNGNRSGDALYVDVRGSFGYVSQASQTGNAGDGGVGCRIDINASRSSAIFGSSDTVQPSSMYQLVCIKI